VSETDVLQHILDDGGVRRVRVVDLDIGRDRERCHAGSAKRLAGLPPARRLHDPLQRHSGTAEGR
jgi:hypothetical protein